MRGFRGGFMGGIGIAVATAAAMFGAGHVVVDTAPPAPSHNPRRRHRQVATGYGGGRSKTTWHQPHGLRERQRRMRQIAAGSLRVENGLVADG